VAHDVDQPQHALTVLTESLQPECKQDRKEQHLQNFAGGKGADDRRRDNVHQKLDRALILRFCGEDRDRLRVNRRQVDAHV
jgi:hypothetical protein